MGAPACGLDDFGIAGTTSWYSYPTETITFFSY